MLNILNNITVSLYIYQFIVIFAAKITKWLRNRCVIWLQIYKIII